MKQGWTYKKLGEVATFMSGYTPDKSELFSQGKYPYFKVAEMNNPGNELFMRHTSLYIDSPKKVFPKGCIIFPKNGGAIYTEKKRILEYDSVIDLNSEAIFPNGQIILKYLFCFLNHIKISCFDKGGGLPSLDMKKMANSLIPLPSLFEQQRIVSRLDAAFAHIDELKANAEKQLSEARALFQKALTKAMKPKEGWKEKELGDIVFYFSGYAFESKGYTNNNDDVLLICGDNIVHCDFRWETIKHWPKEEYEDLKRFSLEENDIVLAMDRPWVKSGLKIAKVSPKELPSLLIQRTACIRAPKDISSDFIFYSLQTDKYIKHLVSQQTGVGVPHISGKQILSYKISIPNFKEQQRIVSRLDSLSAHVRELEEVTQKTIAECDALKQALLRKVFE